MFYETLFGILLSLFLANLFHSRASFLSPTSSSEFQSFQRNFLLVYLVMMAADWLQGPYVYKLYAHYGFSREDNGILFIAGFGSSLVFGTWAGPLADKYGRRRSCLFYSITYILSCATKHVNDFKVLMVGRLLGGIATSLLWSAFESWMVSEHLSRGFNPEWISSTFSLMITFNGVVAIACGPLAQFATSVIDHPVAPFDLSALFLAVGGLLVWFTWTENYGETKQDLITQFTKSVSIISGDTRIALVGAQQALFEGAMYTFVFLWTPTLEAATAQADPKATIPYGIIFACFMVACSLGGAMFGSVSSLMRLQSLMRYLYLTAAAAMSTPLMSSNVMVIMTSFIVFEVVVGLFWPGIGTLRSRYIPEEYRATIINLIRVPLNLIVCLVLHYQGRMSEMHVFGFCVGFHVCAAITAYALESKRDDGNK